MAKMAIEAHKEYLVWLHKQEHIIESEIERLEVAVYRSQITRSEYNKAIGKAEANGDNNPNIIINGVEVTYVR